MVQSIDFTTMLKRVQLISPKNSIQTFVLSNHLCQVTADISKEPNIWKKERLQNFKM